MNMIKNGPQLLFPCFFVRAKNFKGDDGMLFNRQRTDCRGTKGFTLAELLIVVAIIAVLVAIAIPIFNNQLERSRQSVDMTNMRNAYSALANGITLGEKATDVQYYYDAASNSLVDNRPAGYGKANTSAAEWWSGIGSAYGIPKDAVLLIEMVDEGNVIYQWGGAYAGLNITNSTDYANLSPEQKKDRDKVLLDSLQDEFRNMTYGQLYQLFYDESGNLRPEFSGASDTDGKSQKLVQSLDGKMCVTIAESSIIGGSVKDSGGYNNTIYLPDLFRNIGYNVSGTATNNYIVNSVNGIEGTNQGKNARLWVDLNVSQDFLKNSANWDKVASNAFTYVKGAGMPTTGIGYNDRKNS